MYAHDNLFASLTIKYLIHEKKYQSIYIAAAPYRNIQGSKYASMLPITRAN